MAWIFNPFTGAFDFYATTVSSSGTLFQFVDLTYLTFIDGSDGNFIS